jgi:transcriptional regulator GlxA family with amidase domain
MDLLRRTRTSLAEIALMAGFCDQAALTRTFSRLERLTLARWRRVNQQLEGLQGVDLLQARHTDWVRSVAN